MKITKECYTCVTLVGIAMGITLNAEFLLNWFAIMVKTSQIPVMPNKTLITTLNRILNYYLHSHFQPQASSVVVVCHSGCNM